MTAPQECRVPSRCEEQICRSLRAALVGIADGEVVPASDNFQEALTAIEYFIPEVLAEIHPEWKSIDLDGVVPILTRKIAKHEVEIIGYAYLFRSQPWSPLLHLQLQMSAQHDALSWFACRIGERGVAGKSQTRPARVEQKALAIAQARDSLDWAYAVTFGSREEH